MTDHAESAIVRKPMLTPTGLVEHLKSKGVTFSLYSEGKAAEYLADANNYLRTASYRKLYDRQTEGDRIGDYIHLDFGYLVELSSLDRKIREVLLDVVMDIEHFAKMAILERALSESEDGYSVVSNYIDSLNHAERNRLSGSLNSRSRENANHDAYSGNLIAHYKEDMPLWVFLEVVEFGRLVDFYRYCAARWNDASLEDLHYTLKSVKAVRNAAAHNSCMLNGLRDTEEVAYRLAPPVIEFLGSSGIGNTKSRKAKLKNLRIAQITAVLYSDAIFCKRQATANRHAQGYRSLIESLASCMETAASKNSSLASFLVFLMKLIDATMLDKSEYISDGKTE